MIANTIARPASAPSFRTGDERLIKLTSSAANKVTTLLTKQGRPNGVLRVAVVGGGCSGLQYGLRLEATPDAEDFVVPGDGFTILMDPMSQPLLEDVTVDFVDNMVETGFRFDNPNAAASCGCGKSFSL
jgi:iron-sulfur cluster assembly accessory protein